MIHLKHFGYAVGYITMVEQIKKISMGNSVSVMKAVETFIGHSADIAARTVLKNQYRLRNALRSDFFQLFKGMKLNPVHLFSSKQKKLFSACRLGINFALAVGRAGIAMATAQTKQHGCNCNNY